MKTQNTATGTGLHPFNIILAGNSNITRGAYLSLYNRYRIEIRDGHIKLIIISSSTCHQFYGLFNECISGVLNERDVAFPINSYYPGAEIIFGKITANHANEGIVEIETNDGTATSLRYIHLVINKEHFSNDYACDETDLGLTINSAGAAARLFHRLKELSERAAIAKDRFEAARILRVAITGNGGSGIEMAVSIATTLQQFSRKYGISNVKPTICLVLGNAEVYETVVCNNKLEKYVREYCFMAGVRIISNKHVKRVNADGAVLNDGSFIPCSFVINTNSEQNKSFSFDAAPDLFGKQNNCNNWCASEPFAGAMPESSGYLAAIRQGRILGNNIVASIENRSMTRLMNYLDYRAAGFGTKAGIFIKGKMAFTGFSSALTRYALLIGAMPASLRKTCLNKIALPLFTREKNPKPIGSDKQVLQQFFSGKQAVRLG